MDEVKMLPLIVAGGPWAAVVAVVGLVVVSLIRGWLVPGRTVEREQAQLIQWGNDWRDAYRAEAARSEVSNAQTAEILAFVRRNPAPREGAA